MHKQHLKGMLKALKPVLKEKGKAKAILKDYWKSRVALVWDLQQVHRAANERFKELLDRYNPQYGVSLETLINLILDSGKGRPLTKAQLKRFIEKDQITIQTGRKRTRI